MIDTTALSRGQIFGVWTVVEIFGGRDSGLFFGGEQRERPRLEKFPTGIVENYNR